MLRLLFVGDVYGKPGRRVLAAQLPGLRAQVDAVVVNGENAAGGFGLNREAFELITGAGADAVTLGNHAWHHKDVYGLLDDPRLIRPLNLPAGTPGRGWRTFELGGERLDGGQFAGPGLYGGGPQSFSGDGRTAGARRPGQRHGGLSRRGHQRKSGAGLVLGRAGGRRDRHPHPRPHR